MAVYQFKCEACKNEFDLSMLMSVFIKTIKITKITECPKCGKTAQLLPTVADVHYKGTGWYVTDYKNKGKPNKKDSV